MKNKNLVAVIGVLEPHKPQHIEYSGTLYPVLYLRIYDVNHEPVSLKIVLSDTGMIHRKQGLHPGDILYLQGSIREFAKVATDKDIPCEEIKSGDIFLVPNILWIVDKYDKAEEVTEIALTCRLDMYSFFQNQVVLSGRVNKQFGNCFMISCPLDNLCRGGDFGNKHIHIYTDFATDNHPEGSNLYFVGGFNKNILTGEVLTQ